MKRITSLLANAAIIGTLAIMATQAHADWPTTKALTLPGGGTNVVTAGYDEGVGRDVYTSFKLVAVEYKLSSATTAAGTIAIRRASDGPAYFTATVTSNTTTGVAFVTNDVYILRGDDIHVTCSTTNSGTVTVIGTEQ